MSRRRERGARLGTGLVELDLDTRYVQRVDQAPTGIVTVRLTAAAGQSGFTIHRPAAYDFTQYPDTPLPQADWIYFGTLYQMNPASKRLVQRLCEAQPGARRFYDVNLRVDSYTPELVKDLMARADTVKLNDAEIEMVQEILGTRLPTFETFAREYAKRYGWRAVAVTRGEQGCELLIGEEYAVSAGFPVEVSDAVGAGDAFGAAFVHGLSAGWPAAEIADFANRLGALVASRPGGVPAWTVAEARDLKRS